MRTLKDPDVRRAEILDTAEQLFTTKGYAQTTILDILNAIGIAKGTFYYYFKSKEEVMDAVISRMVEQDVLQATRIAGDATLSPLEKLRRILAGQQPALGDSKDKMLEQFHQPRNAEMHQKSLVLGIRSMTPVLAQLVREGVEQGLFSTPCPQETIELIMVSGQILFDEGLFQWEPGEREEKVRAFVHNTELLLGAEPGSLAFLSQVLS